MNRTLSNLGPALLLAAVMLAAAALAGMAPPAPWTAVASSLLLVLGLLGADLVHRRRLLPSPSALLSATALLVACGIVASHDLDRLAEMIPLLGSCAAIPIILRPKGARASCRA